MSWPPQYASALVRVGRLDAAEGFLDRMQHRADRRGHGGRQAALARVRGELEAARGRTAQAREQFPRALSVGSDFDALEAAVARDMFGRFLRRRGERRSAVEQLGLAAQRYAALGAEPFLTRCRGELAAAGVTDSPDPVTPWAQLTPQELAVARLASAGRRNQEIADQLVLSVKTVTYHLSHVYAKLGVRSRTELSARWGAAS